jgi:hypothetical protein
MYNHQRQVYTFSFLERQTDFLRALGRRIKFPVSKIVIKLINASDLTTPDRIKATVTMSDAIHDTLRNVDQIFDDKAKGEEFALLLPGTNTTNSQIVVTKIKTALGNSEDVVKKARYSFTIQPIFELEES